MSEVLHFSLNLSFQPINHAVHDIAHVYLNKRFISAFLPIKTFALSKILFFSHRCFICNSSIVCTSYIPKNQQLLVYQPFLQFPSLLFLKYSLLISPAIFFPYNQNLFSLSSDCAFLSHTAQ